MAATRTVEENDASVVYTWRNPAGEWGSFKWYERYSLLQMSLSVLVLSLVRVLEPLACWCYGPFSFMMLAIVSLALRSPILDMHELGGCGVTGGYSIMFWYICNVDLGVALCWPLKESVSAGSGDGSVGLGAEFLAIWGEYGGSERQHSSTMEVGTPGGSDDACTV